jgi:hypothetical protein
MTIKKCEQCQVTSETTTVLRYPSGVFDVTVILCDECHYASGLTFTQHLYYKTRKAV